MLIQQGSKQACVLEVRVGPTIGVCGYRVLILRPVVLGVSSIVKVLGVHILMTDRHLLNGVLQLNDRDRECKRHHQQRY
jgi:hypothetical protein